VIEIVRATPRDRAALSLLFQRIDEEQLPAERGAADRAVRLLVRPESAVARALYDRLGFDAHESGLREKRVEEGDAS
jgi:hypothetical protein